MAATVWILVNNVRHELMNPGRLAYDGAFGLLGTVMIDATGFDNALASLAEMPGLDSTRTNQLGSGLTFATLSALERATVKSLGGY